MIATHEREREREREREGGREGGREKEREDQAHMQQHILLTSLTAHTPHHDEDRLVQLYHPIGSIY